MDFLAESPRLTAFAAILPLAAQNIRVEIQAIEQHAGKSTRGL
jgi:hypothetical protein